MPAPTIIARTPPPPSRVWGLASATFHEAGYEHLVELVHQRDPGARRRLESVELAVYDPTGIALGQRTIDVQGEIVDLAAAAAEIAGPAPRVMAVFDARYDDRIFPYRPHHYGYLRGPGGDAPIYYAVNAALGGVPDRIGAQRTNHFETYTFLRRALAARHSVLLGNLSRFAPATAHVLAFYEGGGRAGDEATLPPKAHAEVALPAEREGRRLERVEVKAPFRLASYVVGRRERSEEMVLFDHLFSYFT